MIENIAWLQPRHPWSRLASVIVFDSARQSSSETEHDTRLYISSLALVAEQLDPIIRSHRAIENSLHWFMAMVFRDDESRLSILHAPANFTTDRHIVLNPIRKATCKCSFRLRRKVAA